ncbi:hypothetical protein JG687_00015150 [Phytophthora cactorum]|uniref:Uncharacterized protein n=1 Tax=Phytophthora cactorum TaxID=29920 RepID=A0A8T1TWP6_9STRA|nr:hypothetical protein JG687_00015150 [Phytophthora cactorum]
MTQRKSADIDSVLHALEHRVTRVKLGYAPMHTLIHHGVTCPPKQKITGVKDRRLKITILTAKKNFPFRMIRTILNTN